MLELAEDIAQLRRELARAQRRFETDGSAEGELPPSDERPPHY